MSDYAATVDFPDYKVGDWWPGIPEIGPVVIDGEPAADYFGGPLTRLRLVAKNDRDTYVLDSDETQPRDGAIVIDDAEAWEASVAAGTPFLTTPGGWVYELKFWADTIPDGLTLYRGTIPAHPNIEP